MFDSGSDGRSAVEAARPDAASPSLAPAPEVGPWLWAERFPLAARLSEAVPSAELAATLSGLELADVDDPALVEVVAAWERVAGWVAAQQASAITELTRRARGSQVDLVPDEVACRLVVSRRAAERKVELAVALDGAPDIHAALATGVIDVRKASVLVHQTDHLPASVAREVRGRVLADAPDLTAPQVAAAVRRVEIQVDAEAAVARHQRARAERCVQLSPTRDSMAWVRALLPAADAMVVMGAVDALAAAAAPEDERGVDARRADALVDVMRQVLDTGVGPDGAIPTAARRHPHLNVTVSAAALDALISTPSPTPVGEEPSAGVPAPQGSGVAELAGYGPIPVGALRELAQQAAWRAVAVDERTGEVTARASRAYRPSPSLAALIIDRDVTCTFPGCRVPSVRCDLDHITPFDPDKPAMVQTTEHNLHALCRHHHRLKTHERWRPERDPATGVTFWVSPTGHGYSRDPVPADPDAAPLRRPRRRATPADPPTVPPPPRAPNADSQSPDEGKPAF